MGNDRGIFTYRPLFHTSMRAVRYAICEARDAAGLTRMMFRWVRKGWQPIGGVDRKQAEWDEGTGEQVVFEYSQACAKYSHR